MENIKKIVRQVNSYKAVLSNGFIMYSQSLSEIKEVCSK